MTTQRPEDQAADLVDRILGEVDAGRLSAPGSKGARVMRRLEGAAAAWRASSGQRRRKR